MEGKNHVSRRSFLERLAAGAALAAGRDRGRGDGGFGGCCRRSVAGNLFLLTRQISMRTCCSCLLALLFLTAGANAQAIRPMFFARTDLHNTEQEAIVLADLNKDGVLDIVVFGPPLQVWLGNRDGTFTALPIQQVGTMAEASARSSAPLLSVADLNGDGNLDIVAGLSTNQLVVEFGNGDGTFQMPGTKYTISDRPTSLVIADINGDGYLDIVSASFSGNIEALVNDGRGNLALSSLFSAGSKVGAVAVQDVNGDRIPDIVFGVNGKLEFLLGTGSGAFRLSSTISITGLPGSLFFADFNGDGKVDLAVGGSAWVDALDQVTILFGNGQGLFGKPQVLTALGVTQIAVGDVNRDGHPDLVVLENNPDVVGVYINRGNGTFKSPTNYSAVGDATDLALGSLRNNGLLDIVVTGSSGLEVSILLNEGKGIYKDGFHISIPYEPTQLVAADFNRDGIDDLAVAGNGKVQVFLATGQKPRLFSPGQSIQEDVVSLVSGDFNNDGVVDLAFSNSSDQLGVMFGYGDGTFSAPIYTLPGGTPNFAVLQICTGDFNRDGNLDLATAYNSVLLGNGDGTFGQPLPILPETILRKYVTLEAVASTDLNGDGRSDIVAEVGPATANIFSMISDGSGGFTIAGQSLVAGVLAQMVLSDINNDGLPDLLVTLANSSTSFLLGQGNGMFAPAVTFPIPPQYNFGLVAADFNGDGVTDLAISTDAESSVALYTGIGKATFMTPAFWGTAPGSTYVVTGHFFGTRVEYPDLAVAAIDGIDILLNTTK